MTRMKKASFVTIPSQEFFNNSSNNDNNNDSDDNKNSSNNNNNDKSQVKWNLSGLTGNETCQGAGTIFYILIDFELWFYSLNGFAGMRGKGGGAEISSYKNWGEN